MTTEEVRQTRGARACVPLAIVLTLALATFLRLWGLRNATFNYDPAAVSNLAAAAVDTGVLPAHGMVSSTGILNPPLFVYLLTLPVFFSRDPSVTAGFIALLNVAAVWGCFYLGRRYWGAGVGIVAALLYAVSPWAVEQSRSILGQTVLPPGVMLLFGLLYAWWVDERPWALSGALVVLAALTQLHFSTLALIPVVGLLLLADLAGRLRRRQGISPGLRAAGRAGWAKPFWVGVGAGLLLYVPYFAWDARNGWQDVRLFLETVRMPAQLHWEVIDAALYQLGGRNIHSLAGPERFREFLSGIVNLKYWPDRVLEAGVVLAVVCLFIRCGRERRQKKLFRRDTLLLLWLVTPILFFIYSRSEVNPHYLIQLRPAPYLALAVAAAGILSGLASHLRWQAQFRGLAVFGLVVLVGWQVYLLLSIYAFVAVHNTPGGVSTPSRILTDVVRTVRRYASDDGDLKILMLCPGSEPRWDECPAVFKFLTGPSLDVAFMDYNDPLIWSHQDDPNTLAVLAPGDSLAARELPRFAQPLPDESVPLREGVAEYRFYRIRDPYRDLARYLEAAGGPGDAIVLVGAGQRSPFEAARRDRAGLPIYELSEPRAGTSATVARLERLIREHRRIYAIFRAAEESDPAGVVDTWLSSHSYRGPDRWLGPVRFVSYVAPASALGMLFDPVQVELGDQFRLAGYALPARTVAAGDLLLLAMDWRSERKPDRDYAVFVQLLDASDRVVAQRDAMLLSDGNPSSTWQPPQGVETLLAVLIQTGTPPGEYRLVAGLYDPQTGLRLPAGDSDHLDLGAVYINRPAVPLLPGTLDVRYPCEQLFGEVSLLGYDHYKRGFGHAPDTPLHPGDVLHLVFFWRADMQPTRDWRLEASLVDDKGRDAATIRAGLAGAPYPTTHWLAGEVVRSEHDLPLPADLPPGRYRLFLSLHGDTAEKEAKRVDLGPITLRR